MNTRRFLIFVSLSCVLARVPLASTRTISHGDVAIAMTACRHEPWCKLAVEFRTAADHHAVGFKLGEGGPQGVETRPLEIPEMSAFSVVAIAMGGSDYHVETTILTVIDGRIREALPSHVRTTSQDLVCLNSAGPSGALGLVIATFVWGDESHYDAHRYTITQYKWQGQSFSQIAK